VNTQTIARSLSLSLFALPVALGVMSCASTAEATRPTTAEAGANAPMKPAPATTTAKSDAEQRLAFQTVPVHFGFDDTQINEEGMAKLRALAAHLQRAPGTKVRIVGHADDRGTNEYNLNLGDSRARVARDTLVRLGVAPDRILTVSRGEEEPVAVGSGESFWAQNRRDEFILLEEVAAR
jgi:peptidoglycan-associated lipoprotein